MTFSVASPPGSGWTAVAGRSQGPVPWPNCSHRRPLGERTTLPRCMIILVCKSVCFCTKLWVEQRSLRSGPREAMSTCHDLPPTPRQQHRAKPRLLSFQKTSIHFFLNGKEPLDVPGVREAWARNSNAGETGNDSIDLDTGIRKPSPVTLPRKRR